MALMSACLARLGSRYSLILDPMRREIQYGALGLLCQQKGDLVVEVENAQGLKAALPLCKGRSDFFCVDQHLTMTSVRYEATSVELGLRLEVDLVAPFWPQDETTSLAPAYLAEFKVSHLPAARWQGPAAGTVRRGHLRFGVILPGVRTRSRDNMLRLEYPVRTADAYHTGEGGEDREYRDEHRKTRSSGRATDLVVPLDGPWKLSKGLLEVPFDVETVGAQATFSAALVGYCGDAMFERFGAALPLKYTAFWSNAEDVAAFVKKNHAVLLQKSRMFDELFVDSGLPKAAQDLSALSFQSYLMCTLWATGTVPGRDGRPTRNKDWFSVWEGSCWFNSTVDVTYNEAAFYFSCWPKLLELQLDQWSQHANNWDEEQRRRTAQAGHGTPAEPMAPFPGAILEHDMGAGWTANGQSYHHGMPVEENANYLLLLYAHGRWWGRATLYRKHRTVCCALAEYLLWSDSTGNGFPDQGTANTIDDANPAVQYGRDNVYLGVKRMAALHAAARIFEATGDRTLAQRCHAAVRKAMKTLNAGWQGDHYPVVLDPSAEGLTDSWTGKPLPYKVLPGWDAYSLYTSNGLLYLLMIGDVPPGLDLDRIRVDLLNTVEESLTPYGCSHSSFDPSKLWVSMNVWRDCVAAYLGENLLPLAERYWAQQVFANGLGSEKPNCFTETSLSNNLVWYPRGADCFALPFAAAGLVQDRTRGMVTLSPMAQGRWPLLPLADWKRCFVPVVVAEKKNGRLMATIR